MFLFVVCYASGNLAELKLTAGILIGEAIECGGEWNTVFRPSRIEFY